MFVHPVGLKNKEMFYYTYILVSEIDNLWYTGYTSNLEERLKSHNEGKVASTKKRIPFRIIYFEACMNQKDAVRREKYLKSGNGKIFIKSRLRHFFNPTG